MKATKVAYADARTNLFKTFRAHDKVINELSSALTQNWKLQDDYNAMVKSKEVAVESRDAALAALRIEVQELRERLADGPRLNA
jgi:septal ring factor EnvC (AmiA/AmiB activator)